jgi:hypothetical protein
LKKVRDPFVFNALSQKASKLGIEERLLREHARPIAAKGSDRRRQFELKRPTADAGFKAEVGLVALAIFHPLLRKEIQTAARTGDFEDRTLGELVLEMPADESGLAELESRVSERLQPEQRSIVSALAVDPQMDDPERARKLAGDFLRTLERRRTRREIESLTRGAAGSDDPSAAQAVIVLRRGADGRK